MARILTVLLLALLIPACFAETRTMTFTPVETSTIDYQDGDVVLEGFLARPSLADRDLPGVLVCHAWKGIGAHERDWAEKLAEFGCVSLHCNAKSVTPSLVTQVHAAGYPGSPAAL